MAKLPAAFVAHQFKPKGAPTSKPPMGPKAPAPASSKLNRNVTGKLPTRHKG